MYFDISFDPLKSLRNEVERGLPFSLVMRLEWESALIKEDTRKDYSEQRFRVLGLIDGRLHGMVFTPRADKVHVISLRKANNREVKQYEQAKNSAAHTRH
ncbi:MAG: BrnT family toxin [Rhodoferax sp.]